MSVCEAKTRHCRGCSYFRQTLQLQRDEDLFGAIYCAFGIVRLLQENGEEDACALFTPAPDPTGLEVVLGGEKCELGEIVTLTSATYLRRRGELAKKPMQCA